MQNYQFDLIQRSNKTYKMKSSIFLMCLALLLISPSCLGYTDEEREADGRKIAEIIRTSQDDDSKINNTQELLDIYRRLLPGLTPEERANIDELIKEHTDEVIIDGVPSQGGASKYIGKILTPVMKDVASGFFLELGTQLGRLFSW
ncbi:protein Turandot C-like [Drosophila gunungcola]|uniref:protein Turandot C-like n=1 Tax=Drosophila gunungcola TaxID=103775 RepID=UPI0022DF8DD4|nr:protein Turandot C-like [Drosophila gunungcola]